MEILDALLLGLIQGLTEFLPVSSSGHLEIGKALLGQTLIGKESLQFTVVVHFATALSTVFVYRKDVLTILKKLTPLSNNDESRFTLGIIISLIPAGLIGFFFESHIETLFNGNIFLVGIALIFTGLLLAFAHYKASGSKPVSPINAFFIGCAQAIAILPGISRSGATIATSLLLGIDKQKAARFSFLMVVPLIFGKIAKDMLSGDFFSQTPNLIPLTLGFIAAFFSGLWACKFMIKLVAKNGLLIFAIYCVLIGALSIVLSL